MRMMMAWIVGLGSLLMAGLAAAGDFEGIIVMKETSEGTTTQQVWYLKGDRLRFEEAGQDADNSAMIFDAKKKVMYSLHHDDKIYLEIPTADSSTPDPMEDMLSRRPVRARMWPGTPARSIVRPTKPTGAPVKSAWHAELRASPCRH